LTNGLSYWHTGRYTEIGKSHDFAIGIFIILKHISLLYITCHLQFVAQIFSVTWLLVDSHNFIISLNQVRQKTMQMTTLSSTLNPTVKQKH